MKFLAGDRVEVSITDGSYPWRQWVRRGCVRRAYPSFVVVVYDDSKNYGEYTVPHDRVRKLSILELLAEAADDKAQP